MKSPPNDPPMTFVLEQRADGVHLDAADKDRHAHRLPFHSGPSQAVVTGGQHPGQRV